MPQHADLGLIGLAVMGRNLALNIADHGYSVAVYNRTRERTDEFVTGEARELPIIGVHTLGELVQTLEQPRIVVLMIKAGEAVDAQIEALGYRRLAELGAPRLKILRTVGGGAANRVWSALRRRIAWAMAVPPIVVESRSWLPPVMNTPSHFSM